MILQLQMMVVSSLIAYEALSKEHREKSRSGQPFIGIEGLKAACADCNLQFCTGCFSGSYPIEAGHHTKSQFK